MTEILRIIELMDGFCPGQKKVEEKSNEITAIPQLLDTIQVKGE